MTPKDMQSHMQNVHNQSSIRGIFNVFLKINKEKSFLTECLFLFFALFCNYSGAQFIRAHRDLT